MERRSKLINLDERIRLLCADKNLKFGVNDAKPWEVSGGRPREGLRRRHWSRAIEVRQQLLREIGERMVRAVGMPHARRELRVVR